MNRSYHIFIRNLLIFINAILLNLAVCQPTLIKSEQLYFPENTKLIFNRNGENIGHWNSEYFKIDQTNYQAKQNERIIDIQKISLPEKEAFLVISLKDKSETDSNIQYTLFSNQGKERSSWILMKYRDRGIPKVDVVMKNYFIFSYPEDQFLVLMNMNGNEIQNFYLFPEPNWNHEKNLKIIPSTNEDYFIIGMTSANLKDRENIVMFRGYSDRNPDRIATLPLSLLDNAVLNDSSILCITGLVSKNGASEQSPQLLLFDLKKIQFQKHSFLPKKMLWIGNRLFAVNSTEFAVFGYGINNPIKQIKFPNRIIPFKLFQSDGFIHLLYSNSGSYKNRKFEYADLRIFTLNINNLEQSDKIIEKIPFQLIQISSIHNGRIAIRFDNRLKSYELKQ